MDQATFFELWCPLLTNTFSDLQIKRFTMKILFYSLLLSMFLMTVNCFAQAGADINLKRSIALIDSAFQKEDIEGFNKIVPLKGMQEFYAYAVNKKLKKASGASKIIRLDKDSAWVFLSGMAFYGNSGDETSLADYYTGIYKFQRTGLLWEVKDRLNIDRLNQIKKHKLGLDVLPGKEIKVKDTLSIDVNDFFGFALKLNHKAKLEKLLLNNAKTDFTFGGGLLWVNTRLKKKQQLIIHYTIEIESDEKDKNSAYFSQAYGHMRNQYFWHPFFSFSSANDRADFNLYCTIPKSCHLATSLPQRESLIGDVRIIEAKSEHPTFGLSVYYDRDWEVSTFKKDQIDFVLYATKDFLPEKKALYAEFSKNYDTLEKHFGKPLGSYFGIVQDRSNGDGWKNRSNSVVVAGEKGSSLIRDKPSPRATFGHEIAHGWTSPVGPATNFLMEGWATYAESLLLSSVYGDSIVHTFFQSQKQNYLNGKFNGNKSLWEDYSNSGVSYSKGSWVFYMLEHQLGKKNMSALMANFIRSGDQSVQSFIRQSSRVSGKNMEPFLFSWLKSKEIPVLAIQQSANQLKISQQNDIFVFPLEFKLKLKDGAYLNKVVNINSKEQLLNITEGEIESYSVDPENKVLFTLK
jgi:hypothetical protein